MATVLILTADEIYRLTGHVNAEAAAQTLLESGVELVALKLGGEGCHLISRDQSTHFPAYPVPAVDLTGAGDSFAGAFMGYLASSGSIDERTMTFMPKMLAVACALLFFLPWMVQTMLGFTQNLFANIDIYIR